MDPKELRGNAPVSISVSDDTTKYAHSSPTLAANKNRSYHEIGSTTMGKVDATAARPCAIIGPDRVLPQGSGDVYLKKATVEPWPCSENTYRQPPDYPNRLTDYPPIRNISPRQTFQENMQRIMVPPNYNSVKNSDDNSNLKNPKLNMPQEAKYCDVPYNMNSVTNELKSVRNTDIPMPSVNPAYSRSVPHYGWPGGVNIRPPRPYGAPEIYQFPEYPSCVGPRPMTISHSNRIHGEETAPVYAERLYQEANIRFKPYPTSKEKHQQARYDYINNYQNSFHPPVTFPPHKYDLQKSIQTHPYPMYPQVPLKYLDRRIHETFVDGYQRSNQSSNFQPQYTHNQVIHPQYGPISGNLPSKPMTTSRIQHETNNKTYFDDPSRNKVYPVPDNIYYSDANRAQHLRGEILLPNRSALNMHPMQQHQLYRRDNLPFKYYEFNPHHRNTDQSVNLNYSLSRLPLQYSPNMVAISPSDSNTSNDTTHTIGTSQEDCGYVSQSSTNSVRSLDAFSKDMYRRHEYNIHTMPRSLNSSDKIPKNKNNSSNTKNINVRQFLQMWNEGEDETNESSKETIHQIHPNNFPTQSKAVDNQEQLYVLGLVNVPSEELSKYEHIQKISVLPENIKGYNSIELLNQYEELLEKPSNNNNYKVIPEVNKVQSSISKRPNDKENNTLPRPVSPLDVEAKISQSVIHKEVGCNFEIKPCSPEMLNVEVATPIQNILGERIIEKMPNPVTSKSAILPRNDDIKAHNSDRGSIKIASCDIINKQYHSNNYISMSRNNNFNVQDFESNSGISLASLPRLDNDIELNFPEINQQFIKANNMETEAHLFQKDLIQLSLVQTNQEKSSYQHHSSLSPQLLGSAPEKEFSKLSKYRKNKKCDMVLKDDIIEKSTVAVQQRINSVIIKNPETKLLENNAESFPNKTSETIHYNYTEQDHEKLFSPVTSENSKDKQVPFDTAIDFSVNKSETEILYDCVDKAKTESHNYETSGDNHRIKSRENEEKNISVEQQPLELHLKQIKDQETVQGNKNKEAKEYSESLENQNGISISKEQVKQIEDHKAIKENNNDDLSEHLECFLEPHYSANNRSINISSEQENPSIDEGKVDEKQIKDPKHIKECIHNELLEHLECINEPHYSENDCNVSLGFEQEDTSRDVSKGSNKKNHDANIYKQPIKNSEIQVEKDGALITHESYESVNKCIVETHNFDTRQDAEIHTETISKNQCDELHLNEISNRETLKENIKNNIEPFECSESNIKQNKTYTSYNCLNECHDKPRPYCDNLDISYNSANDKIVIFNDNHENVQEIFTNKKSIKNSEIQEDTDDNSAKMSTVINMTDLKEYPRVEEKPTCIVRPENEFLLERPAEMNEMQTVTDVGTFSQLEKLDTSFQCDLKSEDNNFESSNNKIQELYETNDSEKNFEKPKEFDDDDVLKDSKLFNITKKDVISTKVEFTAVETMLNDEIEVKNFEEIISSTIVSSEDLKHNKVLDVIEINEKTHRHTKNFGNCDEIEKETCMVSFSVDVTNMNDQITDVNEITNKNFNLSDKSISNSNKSPYNINGEETIDKTVNDVQSDNKMLQDGNNGLFELSDELTKYDYKNISNNKFASNTENEIFTNNTDSIKFKEKLINKALLSPWIQKLIIFEVGTCIKNQNKVIVTSPTKCGSSLEYTGKEPKKCINNEYSEQNNLLVSENQTNEKNCSGGSNGDKNVDCNEAVPTNDLSIVVEDENCNSEENETTDSACTFRRNILKRSLSESALEEYKEDEITERFAPNKRKKRNHNVIHPVISDDLCDIIQTNRRNSISTFYNDDNLFILIDNDLIITEENDESEKMFYTEIPDEFTNNVQQNDCIVEDETTTVDRTMTSLQPEIICEEKSIEESWVEDVACIETVVSDDITDDIDYVVGSPIKLKPTDEYTNDQFEFCDYEHIDKIKNSYSSNMCSNDTQILKTLYMTPQMNVNKALLDIESHSTKCQEFNKTQELPSESNDYLDEFEDKILTYNCEVVFEKENINTKDVNVRHNDEVNNEVCDNDTSEYIKEEEKFTLNSKLNKQKLDNTLYSPKRTIPNYSNSSSPEVSSTTPEERNSNILLKNSDNDSRISNEITSYEKLSYKLTESKEYQNYSNNFRSSRTLITKAAQKYIPPLKESTRDLKIKLALPQHRLQTLKQLKVSKGEPKIADSIIKYTNKNGISLMPKKIKPKFEDVLKSIDEIQFKKRKDKKRGKNGIPKVVIKKNENGAHFASCKTANDKEKFNPDLTGRKWQPWVFIEKNNFIDKMAIRNKVKAVYCHRKNNYVLAEKFRKYKSIYNANFVISQPRPDNSVTGTLKYTIRLKHK